jgi:hypothetical protein
MSMQAISAEKQEEAFIPNEKFGVRRDEFGDYKNTPNTELITPN